MTDYKKQPVIFACQNKKGRMKKVEKENKEKGKVKSLVRNAIKENVRNNVNSVSCDYCGIVNIIKCNNKCNIQ